MYFCRIELRREGTGVRDIVRWFSGQGYRVHCQIWSLFADGSQKSRDFLYRQEDNQGWPRFYTISKSLPRDSTGLWKIESKPYTPQLKTGLGLAFSLRANPVRTKRDENNKQHRHDIVMEAKTRFKKQGVNWNDARLLAELAQKEGSEWLAARAKQYGFAISQDCLRVDGYRQHCLFPGKGKKPIRFSTLDFSGLLTVIDPECFLETLYQGLGPAKGFGCGMMMIRRP